MTDEAQTEIVIGLSDAEKKDLEELIKAFKENESSTPAGPSMEDAQKQIKSLSTKLAQFGDLLLTFDTKMKSFYEISLLSYQKSEIMNQRIGALLEIMKGQ